MLSLHIQSEASESRWGWELSVGLVRSTEGAGSGLAESTTKTNTLHEQFEDVLSIYSFRDILLLAQHYYAQHPQAHLPLMHDQRTKM